MEIETLNTMNEALLSLMIIKVIALITSLFAFVGFVIYLVGIAWFCCKETRSPAPRMMKPTMDNDSGDNLTGSVSRPEAVLQQISSTHIRQLQRRSKAAPKLSPTLPR